VSSSKSLTPNAGATDAPLSALVGERVALLEVEK